jgi:hypothetical protein
MTLIPFDQVTNSSLKALATAFGGIEDDEFLSGQRPSFPVISIKGSKFAVTRGGEREVIVNEDGDARSSIDIVVVRAVKGLSKVFYRDAYEEGSSEAPDCYSNSGVVPAPDAKVPQAKSCAACPNNVWGSKINEKTGKKGKLCQDSKRLAVAPLGQLNDPMLLRVPAASLTNWDTCVATLAKKGLKVPAVALKLGFDKDAAYPLLTFRPAALLPEGLIAQVQAARTLDVTMAIVGETALPDEHGAPVDVAEDEPLPTLAEPEPEKTAPKAAPKAESKPGPKAVPKAAPADDPLLAGLEDALAGLSFESEG